MLTLSGSEIFKQGSTMKMPFQVVLATYSHLAPSKSLSVFLHTSLILALYRLQTSRNISVISVITGMTIIFTTEIPLLFYQTL